MTGFEQGGIRRVVTADRNHDVVLVEQSQCGYLDRQPWQLNLLAAHLDSIRPLAPSFYPPEIVEAWCAGLTPERVPEGDGSR